MPPATYRDGATAYTLHEAAQLLGVSLGRARRMIARDELRATRIQRPQGHVWQVWLEPSQHPVQPSAQPPAGTIPQNPEQPPASILALDRAEQLASVVRPLVEAAVAPLRAELADVRAVLSTRDQELGAALERLRALEAAGMPQEQAQPPPDAQEGSPSRSAVQTPGAPSESPRSRGGLWTRLRAALHG